MSVAISFKISDDLAIELDSVAKKNEQARSFHIQKAIEAYLEEYADLQLAFDRLHDLSDSTISLEEMRQKLEL